MLPVGSEHATFGMSGYRSRYINQFLITAWIYKLMPNGLVYLITTLHVIKDFLNMEIMYVTVTMSMLSDFNKLLGKIKWYIYSVNQRRKR